MGIVTGWHEQRGYDTPLPINIPGHIVGEYLFNSHIVGFVIASVLFWGILGTLLTVFVKQRIIAWIVGTYLLVFGGLTILYYGY